MERAALGLSPELRTPPTKSRRRTSRWGQAMSTGQELRAQHHIGRSSNRVLHSQRATSRRTTTSTRPESGPRDARFAMAKAAVSRVAARTISAPSWESSSARASTKSGSPVNERSSWASAMRVSNQVGRVAIKARAWARLGEDSQGLEALTSLARRSEAESPPSVQSGTLDYRATTAALDEHQAFVAELETLPLQDKSSSKPPASSRTSGTATGSNSGSKLNETQSN